MSWESPYTLCLEHCGARELPLVGHKASSLGEMTHAGLPVPAGFAVTIDAYKRMLDHNGLCDPINSRLRRADVGDLHALTELSTEVRAMIESATFPPDVEEAIGRSYADLCRKCGLVDVAVAVRSSATAEDLPGASFAGQYDSFLWVKGVDSVQRQVARCWSSLCTAQAIAYRSARGFPHDEIYMSVAVQTMVHSKTAGVAVTLNPVNGDRSKIVIDASWGFGQAVVVGEVTPDHYLVDKVVFEIVNRTVSCKRIEYSLDASTDTLALCEVPPERQTIQCLSDEEIIAIARIARQIEVYFGRPQDIEWAIEARLAPPGNVAVLQSRPETVWSQGARRPIHASHLTGIEGVLATLLAPVQLRPRERDPG